MERQVPCGATIRGKMEVKFKVTEKDVIKVFPVMFWAGGMYRTASEPRTIVREQEYYV